MVDEDGNAPAGCESKEVVCALVTDEKTKIRCAELGYVYPSPEEEEEQQEQQPEDTSVEIKAKFYLLGDYPSCAPTYSLGADHAALQPYASFMWGPSGLYPLLTKCLPAEIGDVSVLLHYFSFESQGDADLDFCFQKGSLAFSLQGNAEYTAGELLEKLVAHVAEDGGACLEGLAEKFELDYQIDTGLTCADAPPLLKEDCPLDFDESAPCFGDKCTLMECCGNGILDSPAPRLQSGSAVFLSLLVGITSLFILSAGREE
jgi:hypothetical protein